MTLCIVLLFFMLESAFWPSHNRDAMRGEAGRGGAVRDGMGSCCCQRYSLSAFSILLRMFFVLFESWPAVVDTCLCLSCLAFGFDFSYNGNTYISQAYVMSSIHQVYSLACLMVKLILTLALTHLFSFSHVLAHTHTHTHTHTDTGTHTHNRRQAARNENIVVPVHRRSKSLSVCVSISVRVFVVDYYFRFVRCFFNFLPNLGHSLSVRPCLRLLATLHTVCNIRQLKFSQQKIESVSFEGAN